jgi:acyl-CoA synthetase (AMP-forming)/AMP-acid ligase II
MLPKFLKAFFAAVLIMGAIAAPVYSDAPEPVSVELASDAGSVDLAVDLTADKPVEVKAISIKPETVADVLNDWLPTIEGTPLGVKVTSVIIWISSIIGFLSLLGTAITLVSGVTENTKDDRFAAQYKRALSWLQVVIARLALNGGTGRRPG